MLAVDERNRMAHVAAFSRRVIWVMRQLASSVLFRVIATIAFVVLIIARVDFHSTVIGLAGADPFLVGSALLTSYVAWAINSYKLARLLKTYQLELGLVEAFRLNLLAIFYGTALPGQVAGEALKAVYLGRRAGRRSLAYMAIALDRLTGFISLAALGVVSLLFEPPGGLASAGQNPFIVFLGLVTIAGSAMLVVISASVRLPEPAYWQLGIPVKEVLAPLARFRAWGGDPPSPRALVVAVVLGVLFQALATAATWEIALALGVRIAPVALGWILAVVSFAQFLPISIAGIGVREASYVALLALYGVPSCRSLAISLVIFAISIILGLTGGAMEYIYRHYRRGGSPWTPAVGDGNPS